MSEPGPFAEREAALWSRHLPLVRQRLEVIAAAAAQARAGALTRDTRDRALQEAHRLAGILDSYGKSGGSDLARAAEDLLREEPAALGESLDAAVREIRDLIERGPAQPR